MGISRFRHYVVLACAAVLLLWNLGYAPLWNPDEGRYGSSSFEMAQPFDGGAHDWVVPHLNTIPRLNKPPLVYWSAALCSKIAGMNEWGMRLPSALAAIGVLLVLWRMGTMMFDTRTGVLAALVWATSTLPFALARALNTDMLLTFSIALALCGLWQIGERQIGEKRRAGVLVAGIGLGLALLSKGPVGLVLPILIFGVWQILTRGKSAFNAQNVKKLLGACALALLVAAPWYGAIAHQHPEFLKGFLIGENWDRLTKTELFHKPEPFYYYVPVLVLGLFPWIIWLMPAVRELWKAFRPPLESLDVSVDALAPKSSASQSTIRSAQIFLWLWAAAVVSLFSISHVKLITYVLPAFPAFALLIAAAMAAPARVSTRANPHDVPRLWRVSAALSGALILIVAIWLLALCELQPKVLDRIMPRSEALPFLFAGCGVLALGSVAMWLACRARATHEFVQRVAIAQVVTMAFFLLLVVPFAGRVSLYEDPSAMLRALRPHLKTSDEFLEFKSFVPTAMFYLQRPIVIVDVENRSGLAQKAFDASPYFPQNLAVVTKAIERANARNTRVYILVKWKYAHWPQLKNVARIARNNDYFLLSNRSAPAGFSYDFVAPSKRGPRRLSPECQALSPQC
jgi:4-amino-4-deoxy-L-arabinose transferase-like glycosyltransferase